MEDAESEVMGRGEQLPTSRKCMQGILSIWQMLPSGMHSKGPARLPCVSYVRSDTDAMLCVFSNTILFMLLASHVCLTQ